MAVYYMYNELGELCEALHVGSGWTIVNGNYIFQSPDAVIACKDAVQQMIEAMLTDEDQTNDDQAYDYYDQYDLAVAGTYREVYLSSEIYDWV